MNRTNFKNKTEKGITLIALIITIVVLLILAAVAISSITNDGILSYANNAATGYQEAQGKENGILQEYEDVLIGANKGFKKYSITDTVKLKDKDGNIHDFYVIEDSDESQSKLTLMAKKCIDPDTFIQTDSEYEVAFSSNSYWEDKPESEWEDLNQLTVPDGVTSIVTTAKEYGEQLFGVETGRLLTEKEAEDLVPDEGAEDYDEKYAMVFGDSTNGYLYYWLGSACNDGRVFCQRLRRRRLLRLRLL